VGGSPPMTGPMGGGPLGGPLGGGMRMNHLKPSHDMGQLKSPDTAPQSLLPQRQNLGDIIEVGGITINLSHDARMDPAPDRTVRMEAANSDAEAARARIAQVEDEIQKLQQQIDSLNKGGGSGGAFDYASPCIRVIHSPAANPRPRRKPTDQRKIAKAVGTAVGTDLCSCFERLPKPMTAQVDLWSTRIKGKRTVTPAVFIEQPLEVHNMFTLQNVQVLWAPARELPLTTRVAGMCKSGGNESCRDQSLIETEARLSATLTPRASTRKQADERRRTSEEEDEEEGEAEEIWASVRGKRGVGRDHAPSRSKEQRAAEMLPHPQLSAAELRASPVGISPLREQQQRAVATVAATASCSQVRVCMEEV
jgi:hypothetical protein